MRWIVFFAALLFPAVASAVPLQLAHQGRLLDAEQAPLEGQHDLHFGLYDAAEDGSPLWDETVTESFTGGFYSTVLGADEGNPLDDGIFATPPVYLELTVDGGDPLLPRQEINSVPFALRAGTAENVEGGYVDATDVSIDGDLVIDADGNWVGPTPPVDWADLSGIPGSLLDGEDADVLGGLSCSDGFVAKFDVGSGLWACGADDVLDAAGVLAFVDGAVINLGTGSSMAGTALATLDDLTSDTLAGLACADGGVAKYDGSSGLWDCDTDLVLDSTAVLGMVAGATIDLGLGSAVGGVEIATVDDLDWALLSGLPPGFADDIDNDLMADLGPLCADGDRAAWDVGLGDWVCAPEAVELDRLDTTGATTGQVLTFDGTNVGWEDPAAGGNPPCVVASSSPTENWARVECGASVLALRLATQFADLDGGSGHTCGVDADGGLRCWGNNHYGQATPPAGSFVQVSAGFYHSCAVEAGGAVACWGADDGGADDYGQVTDTPAGIFVEVSAGKYHSCARDGTGSVTCWGGDSYGEGTPPAASFQQVDAGPYHTCGIDTGGAVLCWGRDNYGQSTPPSGGFFDLATGWGHACGVTTAGAIECWGIQDGSPNDDGQVTDAPVGTFSDVAAGWYHNCALRSDGTVSCWGRGNYGQTSPPPGTFQSIEAGWDHSCGLRPDLGVAACWGQNTQGQASPP